MNQVVQRSVSIVYKALGPRSRVPVGLFSDSREAYNYLFDGLNVERIEGSRFIAGNDVYTVDILIVDVSITLNK